MSTQSFRVILLMAVVAALGGVALKLWDNPMNVAAPVDPTYAAPHSALATPPPGATVDAFWHNIQALTQADESAWLFLAFVLLAFLLMMLSPDSLNSLRTPAMCMAGYLISLPLAALALSRDLTLQTFGQVRLVGVLLQEVALAGLMAAFVSRVGNRLLRKEIPKILMDIVLVTAYVALGLSILSRAGFNIGGIIATSAVLTAVIGFSLQDTLSNLMGGVVLEVEGLINVGDWIKVGEVDGQVTQIRWRQTTVQTRNQDIAVIPNSVIMKREVIVQGSKKGVRVPHRQWIWFSVDLNVSPALVMDTVLAALKDSPPTNVALAPEPSVVMMDFKDGVGVYALRYFLVDLAANDPTDSRVRARMYTALQRAGIRLAAPQRSLEVREDSEERAHARAHKEHARRLAALARVELFKVLEPAELEALAQGIRYSPFDTGEVITRQGQVSDCIYLLLCGRATVSVAQDGLDKKVASLSDGMLFGEMGVLTGEARSATVTAQCAVECWRMDRETVEGIVRARPEVAQGLALILAERRVDLDAARAALTQDSGRAHAVDSAQSDILHRISRFLGLPARH